MVRSAEVTTCDAAAPSVSPLEPASRGERIVPTNLLLHGVGRPRRPLEPGEERVWISHQQLHAFLDVVDGEPVHISVDDGNASDVDEVLPALVERNLVATFFVLTGRLDGKGSLSQAAVLELRDAGMRIGTHGMHHRDWRRLDDHQAREELVIARTTLSDLLGTEVTEAALPFGSYDRRALARLRAVRFNHIYTSDGWPCPPEAWLQARYSAGAEDDPRSVGAALFGERSSRQQLTQRAKAVWKRLR